MVGVPLLPNMISATLTHIYSMSVDFRYYGCDKLRVCLL
jgi:hypothetical protein